MSGATDGWGDGWGDGWDGGCRFAGSAKDMCALPFEGVVGDALDEIGVRETAVAGGAREPRPVGDVAVGVDVDDVGRVVGGEAHVDATVVRELEGVERVAGRAHDPLAHGVGEHAADRSGAHVVGRAGLPLAGVRDDVRQPVGHAGEVDLVHRQRLGRVVAEERDVHLASLDVPLGEARLLVVGEHARDGGGQRRAVAHHR